MSRTVITIGNIFHGIGASLISSLNQSAMQELKYSELCDKLRLSLEQQCFPQTMRTFSVKTGRGVAVLLTEMDSRIKTYRRKLHRYKASVVGDNDELNTTTVESSDWNKANSTPDVLSVSDGYITSRQEVKNKKAKSISHRALYGLQQETKILLTMQRVLSILQARQTDAYLRLTRMHVLNAANLCEDLLRVWQQKSIVQFQSRRIPSVRRFLSQFVGLSTGVRTHTIGGLRRALAMISLPRLRATGGKGTAGGCASNLKTKTNASSSSSAADSLRSMEGSARSQQSTHSDFPAPLREDSMEWDSEYLELILKKLDSREKQMILQVVIAAKLS